MAKDKSAKPGTKDVGEKKPKKMRPVHPAIAALKENEFLKEVPADFDAKKYQPLKRKNFAEDWVFAKYRGEQMVARGNQMILEAEQTKKLGGKAAVKVRNLTRMQEKFAALKKQLAEQGIDVESVLKQMAS